MPVDDLGDYDVDPVEGNPFGAMAASPNDYHVEPVDHDPFAQLDKRTEDYRAAHPEPAEAPAPAAPEPYPVIGGDVGQALEGGYQKAASGLGSAMDWAGDKLEKGVGIGAATLGMPAPSGFARDIRGMIESGEMGVRGAREPPPRALNPSGLYSHGADVAANLPQRIGTAQQMIAALKKQGVKPVEMEASGVGWLDEQPSFLPTKAEDLAEMFHRASPPLQETTLRDDDPYHPGGATKYDRYTIPGGENYREVLLHTPSTGMVDDEGKFYDPEGRGPYDTPVGGAPSSPRDFDSSHWDTPNVVAHLRLNDRTGANGENLLHLEELQSDWGQAGRDRGFTNPGDPVGLTPAETAEFRTLARIGNRTDAQNDRYTELHRLKSDRAKTVPAGPYVGSTQGWTDLGLKRALVEAARGGYDGLTWTTGADQAKRYDLGQYVDSLQYAPDHGTLYGYQGGDQIVQERMAPEDLPGYVGKEVAEKLLAQPVFRGAHRLAGEDLMVGGHGMKGYYDNILPNRLATLTKKLDPSAKIGQIGIPDPEASREHAIVPYSDGWAVRDNRSRQEVSSGHRTRAQAQAEADRLNANPPQKAFPHLPLTPLMREQILKGLPQYARGGGVVDQNAALRGHLELLARPRHGFAGGGGLMDQEEQAQRQREGIATADSSVSDVGMGFQAKTPGMFGGARPVQPSPQFGTSPDQTPPTPPGANAPLPTPRQEEPALPTAPLRQDHPAFPQGRIATTTPFNVAQRDLSHQSGEGTIGHDTMQASTAMYPKTAEIIKQMPYEGTKVPVEGKKPKTVWTPTEGLNVPADATPEEAHEHFIEFTKNNLLALHDAVAPEIREGSMQWYDGANKIATDRALKYGKPVENTAGVYAALSPQMDWYKNASLGDRVMDTMHTQQDTAFTPAMWKWARTYAKGDPDTLALYRSMAPTKDSPGRTLGSINDPDTKAHWIRAFDEAHNSRDYNLVNPDGSFGSPVQKADGSNAGAGWGTMDMISNAVRAFEAPDMPTISQAMGGGHKVRNFYNNILNPNDTEHGDVTIDTHAIAGALLRPLSGSDKDTVHGLGTSGPESSATGAKALYGAYAEAYRRAARERGLLPRQMQSITWEAIRGLFSAVQKRTPSFRNSVNDVWNRFKNGLITQQQAQHELMVDPETGASRIRPPSWHTGTAVEEEE